MARLFAAEGVTKIRLTGGEPLLRRDLERLVEMLAGTDGITELALTTNGAMLAAKASSLADAGLTRVTVSLDALDDEVFGAMNDVSFPVSRVLAGIEAATDAGLSPVKINMVVRRGINDHCLLAMAGDFAAPISSCVSSSTWMSELPTAGACRTSSLRQRLCARSQPAGPCRRWTRTT